MNIMEIDEFQKFVHEFKYARGWEKRHEPKDLLLGLVEEIGEFRNLIKWKNDAQIRQTLIEDQSPEARAEIVDFFGDMLWYLGTLADYCQIDMREAMDFIQKEFQWRFPVEKTNLNGTNPKDGGYDGKYAGGHEAGES